MTEEERVAADKARKDAEEKEASERDERARQDAANGEKLDKILSHLGEINKRVDSLEGMTKDDAEDEKCDEDDKLEGAEAGAPERVAADRAKKDAEVEEEIEAAKKDAEAARKDSAAVRAEFDEFKKTAVRHISDEERATLATIHANANKVYAAFGDSASFAMPGEDALSYRRRLARGLAKHSPIFSKIDLGHLDAEGIKVAEAQIYADAMQAAHSPVGAPEGKLRAIETRTAAGHTIIDYVGVPADWMKKFSSTRRHARAFGQPNQGAN